MLDEIESELKQMIEASDTGGVGGSVANKENRLPMKQKLMCILKSIAVSLPVLLLFAMTVSEH